MHSKKLLISGEPAARARRAVNRVAAPFYAGSNCYCPCCGGNFRKFKRFGLEKRREALCPRCMSLERHRYLWMFLEDSVGIEDQTLRVLHVSPAPCIARHLEAMDNISYLSIDLRSSAAMLKADITDLPFEGASFDLIICSHVLEHVTEDRKAMAELFRVLAGGGRALIQAPVDDASDTSLEDAAARTPGERERLYGFSDHVRTYGRDLAQRLREAGFAVTEYDCTESYDAETLRRCRIERAGSIYLCLKD
ncbi:MAG: class I SAM-dependent methyltransferase [Candidatus Geothermincolia bacterium]